jgi:hypothetical protein
MSIPLDHANQGESRGTVRRSSATAAFDFWRKTDVRSHLLHTFSSQLCLIVACRPDDKKASDFGIVAGAVLHLVLALRGGF